MNKEPVLTTSAVTSIVIAVIGLLVAFGLNVSEKQTAAIITVAVILVKTGGALYARSKVKPVTPARK